MNDRPQPDESVRLASMSEAQKLKVDALTEEQVVLIDECLTGHVKPYWRKLSMVLGLAMADMEANHGVHISYVYFYERLIKCINSKGFEIQGNIDVIRWSEVCSRA